MTLPSRLGRKTRNHLYGQPGRTACGKQARCRTVYTRPVYVNCGECLVEYRTLLLAAGIVRWLLELARATPTPVFFTCPDCVRKFPENDDGTEPLACPHCGWSAT